MRPSKKYADLLHYLEIADYYNILTLKLWRLVFQSDVAVWIFLDDGLMFKDLLITSFIFFQLSTWTTSSSLVLLPFFWLSFLLSSSFVNGDGNKMAQPIRNQNGMWKQLIRIDRPPTLGCTVNCSAWSWRTTWSRRHPTVPLCTAPPGASTAPTTRTSRTACTPASCQLTACCKQMFSRRIIARSRQWLIYLSFADE